MGKSKIGVATIDYQKVLTAETIQMRKVYKKIRYFASGRSVANTERRSVLSS